MLNDSSEGGEGGLIVVRFAPVFSKAQHRETAGCFIWPLASRHGSFRADMAPFKQTLGLESFGPLLSRQPDAKNEVKKVPIVLAIYVWRV